MQREQPEYRSTEKECQLSVNIKSHHRSQSIFTYRRLILMHPVVSLSLMPQVINPSLQREFVTWSGHLHLSCRLSCALMGSLITASRCFAKRLFWFVRVRIHPCPISDFDWKSIYPGNEGSACPEQISFILGCSKNSREPVSIRKTHCATLH